MNPFQFILEGISIASHAVRAHRLRSFLTMLGVAIGIFVISSILTMVDSMQKSVTENLSMLGNTTLFVHNWPWKDNSEDWYKYWGRPKVSYRDFVKVKNNLKNVVGVSYQVSKGGQVLKYNGRSMDHINIAGGTADQEKFMNVALLMGRSFTELEYQRGLPVCNIGYDIYRAFFGDGNAIGKSIRLGGKRMVVVGVLSKQGMSFGPSQDLTVYIPYRFMSRLYNLSLRRGLDKVLMVKANDYELVESVESELIGLMRASRGLKPSSENNFSINKQEMLMDQIGKVFSILETGGIVVSIFSLLIGAFSIGNIMYISVKERTREIGIQKSLGATRTFILYQFLTESVIICFMGGLIGMLLVFGLVEAVSYWLSSMQIDLTINLSNYALAVGTVLSVGTGLLAGVIPASIAARLDPVEAIRSS